MAKMRKRIHIKKRRKIKAKKKQREKKIINNTQKTTESEDVTKKYSIPKYTDGLEACKARVIAGQKCFCRDVCHCRNCSGCVSFFDPQDNCVTLCRKCDMHIPCEH